MGSVGDCDENALAESFFATLECELLAQAAFPTQAAASGALFDFIAVFYNHQRRHAALGHLSPNSFERRFLITPVVA
jgi:putative transposase